MDSWWPLLPCSRIKWWWSFHDGTTIIIANSPFWYYSTTTGKDRDDRSNNEIEETSHEDENENDLRNDHGDKNVEKRDRGKGQPEETRWENGNKSEFFQRKKRTEMVGRDVVTQAIPGIRDLAEESSGRNRRETISYPRKSHVLTSTDVYQRAMRRERIGERVRQRSVSKANVREKRSTRSHASVQQNVTECTRHELYVDFKEIGLSSSIIAPLGYSAYHCKGICESPLSQDQQPTNHATIQGIVHKMGLVRGVERPCCVPTKLLGTTILFFDDNENVVLKVYQDMIADRCGCR